jgi:hypothetical protein
MRWGDLKTWDGETCKDEIASALMKWFDSGIKHQALITSYGELGVLMKTRYHNAGSLRDGIDMEGAPQGVCIRGTFCGGKRYECRITWNKAAKLVQAECKRIAGK